MLNMYLSFFKKASLVIALLLTGTLTGLAQSTSVTLPTADTWVSTTGTQAFGANSTFEIRTYAAGSTYYYGLLSFRFAKPAAGYRVRSAKLRLVTRSRVYGQPRCNVYACRPDEKPALSKSYDGWDETEGAKQLHSYSVWDE